MLGKLKKIDLRKAWEHEALDFTRWLAEKENLAILSEEIGIDIKLLQTEAQVGKFNVDILAEDETTGKKIIIENQLEYTDHDHLGKLITYASGYDAEIIIWIVREVRDEHKQAVDWLNEHTDEKLNFFLIKMELWQIGESPFAPKFQIISNPNDWAKMIKTTAGKSELSTTKGMQLEFWNKFKEYASSKNTNLRLRKVYPQHWCDISYGNSESHIDLTINTQANKLGCEIYIPDSKDLFNEFYKHKKEIEDELGEKLEWLELPRKKASRIKLLRDGDIEETDKWDEYFEWFKVKAEKLQSVFGKYYKKIRT
ncbi:MAG: DUF4268 domain-containing protein [Nanoarchaeota archaeon]|nr:DUF4268 domain-containing protein [Nanoarchaeota archaeon]